MNVKYKIKSFTPIELAQFLTELSKNQMVSFDLKINIKPETNELTGKEACQLLNISYSRLIKLTSKGIAKMKKHGGRNVYFKNNLLELRKKGIV